MRIVSQIEVPPGTYRLMVGAAQTPSDVRGSVMTEIHIPDFDRQPLAVSGIAVATSGAGRMLTTRTDELLDDVLGRAARRRIANFRSTAICGSTERSTTIDRTPVT